MKKNVLGRLVSAFLAVTMCVSMALPIGAARVDSESGAAVKLTVGDGTLSNTTDELQVPVTISFKNDEAMVEGFALTFKFDESALILTDVETKIKKDYAITYGGLQVSGANVAWAANDEGAVISNQSIVDEYGTDVLFWLTFKTNSSYLNGDYSIDCNLKGGYEINFVYADEPVDFYVDAGTIALTGGLDLDDLEPTINTQPVGASYTYGTAAVAPLTVAATVPDNCALSYQWCTSSDANATRLVAIDGATQATYTPSLVEYGTKYYVCAVTSTYQGTDMTVFSNVVAVEYKQATLDAEVTLAEAAFVYDGTEVTLDVTVEDLVEGLDYELTGNTATNAGTYTLTVTGKGNYVGTKTVSWKIDPKIVFVEWGSNNFVYSGEEQAPTASYKDVDGEYVPATVTGAKINASENAYTATASISDKNYVMADSSITCPFTIEAMTVPVVWTDTAVVYNAETQRPTATATGVAGYNVPLSVEGGKKDVGTYSATATSNDTNYVLSNATTDYTIEAFTDIKDETVKQQNVVVDGGTFTAPAFSGVKGEKVEGTTTYTFAGAAATADEINGQLKQMNKGETATIGYSFTATGNYTGTITGTIIVTMVDIIFTVNGADATVANAVTIKANPTYGDTWAQIVTVSDKLAASVDGDSIPGTFTLAQTGMPNAGDNQAFQVVFNAAEGDRYKNVPVVNGTVNVAPKSVDVVWSDEALVYNAQAQAPTASYKDINGADVVADVAGAEINAGEGYTATASTTDTNYALTNTSKTFAIAKKPVAVEWQDLELTYNGSAQKPVVSATGVGGNAVPVSFEGEWTNAGTYAVAATTTDTNYELTNAEKSFRIAPLALEMAKMTFGTIESKEYNGTAFAPVDEVVATHAEMGVLDNQHDLSISFKNNINAGQATVSVTGKGNYSGTLSDAIVFTITPKNVDVVWGEAELTYNGEAQAPEANAMGVNGAVALNIDGKQTNVGEGYTATASTDDENYTLSNTSKNFSISALTLKSEEIQIAPVAEQVYTGEAIEPAVSITHLLTEEALQTGRDVTLTFADNINAGVAKATVTGKGNYYGILPDAFVFTIKPAKIDAMVVISSDTAEVTKGSVLTAAVEGKFDEISYQWLKDGEAIPDATTDTYTVPAGMSGSVITVAATSTGNYAGTVTSTGVEVGKLMLAATVAITGEPAVDAQLTAEVSGEGEYDFAWMRNGTAIEGATAQTYTVTKADQGKHITVKLIGKGDYTGEIISASVDVPAGAPDAPALTATPASRRVELTWTAPADNGAVITGYQIKVGDGEWTDVGNVLTYTVYDLENRIEYTFYLRAVNAVGAGEESSVVAAPKASAGVVPSGGGPTKPEEPKPEEPKPEEPKVTTKTDEAGNTTTVTEQEDGSVSIKAELNADAVAQAVKNDTAIELPMDAVQATGNASKATEITIETGAKDAVKVEIPVANVAASTVAAVVGADGEKTIVRDSVATEDGIVISVEDGAKVVVFQNSKSFSDVAANHWGKNAVEFAYSRNLFAGVSDTKFAPEVAMNRAMIAQVLYNLNYAPATGVNSLFPDVATGEWFASAVAWAAEKGIVSGYGNGTYQPNKDVTREELVIMLWNYSGKPAAKGDMMADFADGAKVSDWAKAAMEWALNNGVLSGKGGKMLDPQGLATRVEVAQMIKNFLEKN